jgi:hypothetical protein
MRWVEFAAGFQEYESMVTDSESGITLYDCRSLAFISAIKWDGNRYWIYETDFREMLEIDVTELLPGDVIWHCMEDGPVSSHRQHRAYPNEEMVYFQSGNRDSFGKPQKIEVLRGGQF